jgi:hypothetical protein
MTERRPSGIRIKLKNFDEKFRLLSGIPFDVFCLSDDSRSCSVRLASNEFILGLINKVKRRGGEPGTLNVCRSRIPITFHAKGESQFH